MRTKRYILLLTLFSLIPVIAPPVCAGSEKSKEYQVKAAFIYNFLRFVEWPEDKGGESNKPIIIGIIGSEEFIKAFEPIKRKKINNRNISIKYFAGYENLKKGDDVDDDQLDGKMGSLKVCHVLMFCVCDSVRVHHPDRIMDALKDHPILTIGETDGFLESGGIINFVKEKEKVRFEINNKAARKVKLTIRSKLLRLARKVIDEKASNGAKN